MIDYQKIFESPLGREIYTDAARAIKEHSMERYIKNGVLVGFSGGADSVLLLLFLLEYRRRTDNFEIVACHINHMIRGDEADRDELFSKEFADSLGVTFLSAKIDVPKLACENGIGIEEAARDARYLEFQNIIASRRDVSAIAVAHNSTDNLETVILNLMRGSGTRGLSGIAPARDNIIRPLIFSSKADIAELLNEFNVGYVTDSTNLSDDYNRNYVRNQILPLFARLSPKPEEAAERASHNLRLDADFIDSLADDFLKNNLSNSCIPKNNLESLHPALFSRVLMKWFYNEFSCYSESVHIDAVRAHMNSDNFKISFPASAAFVCERGLCFFQKNNDFHPSFFKVLNYGVNTVDGIKGAIVVSDVPISDSFSNVYKIAIQEAIDFGIINGELSVRTKRDGDAYAYGGITRKLKKLFNDRSIPPRFRDLIPVICDVSGIIWVPGFRVRECKNVKSDKKIYIAVALPKEMDDFDKSHRFYIGNEFC